MLSEQEKATMKKYRHLIACMIDCSIGYFTPLAALRAIEEHKQNKPYFCEWYMDIAWKRLRREGKARFDSRAPAGFNKQQKEKQKSENKFKKFDYSFS